MKKLSVFISYSHKNKRLANRLVHDLKQAKIAVWIDRENLEVGDPLIDKVQAALNAVRWLALLWSRAASHSRYVKAEWQAAYQLNKGIIPCLLDKTRAPPFLLSAIHCDFRTSYETGFTSILAAFRGSTGGQRGSSGRATRALSTQRLIATLTGMQNTVIAQLVRVGPDAARAVQTTLDPLTEQALDRAGNDAEVLNLAGYHRKNAHMIRFSSDIESRAARSDPRLAQAEALFHRSLAIQPQNASALNGLGSVLLLRGDLSAAEFFVRHAIARARKEGFRYQAAEQDLRTIERLRRGSRRSGTTARR